MDIMIENEWIKDSQGRTLMLRGVNLSGSTKVPYKPDGATWRKENFFDYKDVSFVGRPFPIEDADEHFKRLKSWGFTFLRFLITWEAVEHKGPGIYDEEYLDYLEIVLSKAAQYGITVFIDPHQDVWSRWTGGDGAPAWTLEKVGMDITKLDQTGSAFTHTLRPAPFPKMIWPCNYNLFAAATMFTLFFAGNDFAPDFKIDGVNARDFLQSHYFNTVKKVVEKLKHLPNVIGYDTLNEPWSGYIGLSDVNRYNEYNIIIGPTPTPFQAMAAASGYKQTVIYSERRITGDKITADFVLNQDSVRLWKEGFDCVWKQHGVWTDKSGTPQIVKSDYFKTVRGKTVNFIRDYLRPFIKNYTSAVRSIKSSAFIFIEEIPGGKHIDWQKSDGEGIVNATHFYDVITLFTKTFNRFFNYYIEKRKIILGSENVKRMFMEAIRSKKQIAEKYMGNIPVLIGETGIPIDFYNKRSYKTNNFRKQEQAFDLYLGIMEQLFFHYTLWNYTPDNNNEHGDNWNDEDLSIFSRDQVRDKNDINSGARGILGFCRPYGRKIAGKPVKMSFDMKSRVFVLKYEHDPRITAPTEIFIPPVQFPKGYKVELSDGEYKPDPENYGMFYYHTNNQRIHSIKIKPVR